MNRIVKDLFNMAIGREFNVEKSELVIELVKENRLIDPFLEKNRDLEIDGESWSDRELQWNEAYEELSNFIQLLKEHKIEYLNLKGLSMLKYYEKNLQRESNDFDFLIKDIHDFFVVHDILIKSGYSIYYFPMLTKINNEIAGIARYFKKLDGYEVHMEINIGKFIIGEVSWFGHKELWEDSINFTFNDISLRIPNDNMTFLILLIEISGRKNMLIRDLVDFHFIRRNGNLDWDYICKLVSLLKDKHLKNTLEKLFESYDCLISGNFIKIKPEFTAIERELNQVIPNILRSKNKIRKMFYRYLIMIGNKLIHREKFQYLLKQIDLVMSPRKRFETGFVTYFLPLDKDIKGNLEWVKYGKHDILITKIGSFLATNFGVLYDNEEEEIRNFLVERRQRKA